MTDNRDTVAPYDPTLHAGSVAAYSPDRLENRYALALYELARDKGAIDAVLADVKALAAGINSSPELQQVLANPTMGRDEQARVLTSIATKLGVQVLTQNFLQLVARKRRQAALPAIFDAFSSEVARRRGELTANVTSAAPLSETQQAALVQALSQQHQGAKITLSITTDASLLGGLRVRIGSRLYDRTLAGQLNRLQQQLNAAA